MSINWVMLSPTEAFTLLPNEQRLLASPPRITLSLQTLNKFPGKEPLSISSANGRVYLTNRRIIYIPLTQTATLQSFAAPLMHLHDTHVTTPFFGPNTWTALVQTVPGGGISAHHQACELKLTFKDGGTYDFHNAFVRVKERVQQALEVSRESGSGGGEGAGGMGEVNLDQLPAYEEASSSAGAVPASTSTGPVGATPPPLTTTTTASAPTPGQEHTPRPDEPPPGYDEVQREVVTEALGRGLRIRDP